MGKVDPAQHYTYGDYLRWDDEQRWELIDGVPYLMAPAPTWRHQELVGDIYAQLHTQLKGKPCRAAISPLDVRLPKGEESDERVDTVVQPDVLVVCEPERIDRRGVRGAPSFVLEVLSPSSASHDQIRKRRVYERAGVQEFWLLHPIDGVLTIYRRAARGEGFAPPEIVEAMGTVPLKAVPDCSVDFDDLYPAPDVD
ncbi:MAG: Uma2 family endonuclease [Lysobacterales bacterium]